MALHVGRAVPCEMRTPRPSADRPGTCPRTPQAGPLSTTQHHFWGGGPIPPPFGDGANSPPGPSTDQNCSLAPSAPPTPAPPTPPLKRSPGCRSAAAQGHARLACGALLAPAAAPSPGVPGRPASAGAESRPRAWPEDGGVGGGGRSGLARAPDNPLRGGGGGSLSSGLSPLPVCEGRGGVPMCSAAIDDVSRVWTAIRSVRGPKTPQTACAQHRVVPDLPLGSAQPATAERGWSLRGHAPDAAGSYRELRVRVGRVLPSGAGITEWGGYYRVGRVLPGGAGITGWRTAQGRFLTTPRFPAGPRSGMSVLRRPPCHAQGVGGGSSGRAFPLGTWRGALRVLRMRRPPGKCSNGPKGPARETTRKLQPGQSCRAFWYTDIWVPDPPPLFGCFACLAPKLLQAPRHIDWPGPKRLQTVLLVFFCSGCFAPRGKRGGGFWTPGPCSGGMGWVGTVGRSGGRSFGHWGAVLNSLVSSERF